MSIYTDESYRAIQVPSIGKATKVVNLDLSTAGTHNIVENNLIRIYNNTDALVSLYVAPTGSDKPSAPQIFITPGSFQDFGNDRDITIHWDAGVGIINITRF